MTTARSHLSRLLLGLAGLVAGGCGQNQFQQEVAKEESAVKLAREVQRGDYGLVTTAELAKELQGTPPLLIDAMPAADSYDKEHLAGARNFLFPKEPMEETWDNKQTGGRSQEDFAALLGEDKDRPIVFYCGFTACLRSHNAAVWARKLGYTNVRRYAGGIYAWKGAGHPLTAAK